jgi:hypothetical protein
MAKEKEKEKMSISAIEKDIQQKGEQIITQSNSSDLIKTLEILSNPLNVEGNTILTNRQVIALSVINWGSQVYDIKFFKSFVKLFPRYRISGDDGRGRKELIQIAEAIQRDKAEQQQKWIEMLWRR